jgi:hypothetical protein
MIGYPDYSRDASTVDRGYLAPVSWARNPPVIKFYNVKV